MAFSSLPNKVQQTEKGQILFPLQEGKPRGSPPFQRWGEEGILARLFSPEKVVLGADFFPPGIALDLPQS